MLMLALPAPALAQQVSVDTLAQSGIQTMPPRPLLEPMRTEPGNGGPNHPPPFRNDMFDYFNHPMPIDVPDMPEVLIGVGNEALWECIACKGESMAKVAPLP